MIRREQVELAAIVAAAWSVALGLMFALLWAIDWLIRGGIGRLIGGG